MVASKMPLHETTFILPCSALEELPTWHHQGRAAELLSAWTLGWHPELLNLTGRLPVWRPPNTAPEGLGDRLVLVPTDSREQAAPGWLEQLQSDQVTARLLTDLGCRQDALVQARAITQDATQSGLPRAATPLVDELAPDFYGLALADLIVELLGHTMHYTSNVDRDSLEQVTIEAARAAQDNDRERAGEKLQRAFDLLAEARDYYYPVESYFLDLTLIAASVWGQPLRDRLQGPVPTSVLMSADQVEPMVATAPESSELLRAMLAQGKATLIGGESNQVDLQQLPLESILQLLVSSQEQFETHLGGRPPIYGRFQGGYSPHLPCLLDGLGYDGALLAAFDGSSVPAADQCRFRWEGADGSSIDTLGILPCDAADAASFLRLAERLSQSMQRDHVATVLFASWPGGESEFYEDLRRAARRCPTFGRFVTMQEYLNQTHGGDLPASFPADAFRSPGNANQAPLGTQAVQTKYVAQKQKQRVQLLKGLADIVAPGGSAGNDRTAADESAEIAVEPVLARLSEAVCRDASGSQSRAPTVAVFNVASLPRTVLVADSAPLEPTGRSSAPNRFVQAVPAMGFSWLRVDPDAQPSVPLAEGQTLRNDFFEVRINRQTGGIESVHDYSRRRNRLSQQIAFRSRSEGIQSYSRMFADEVAIVASTVACGEIVSSGRLVSQQGREIARFEQFTRVARGSRLIELDIRLTAIKPPMQLGEENYFGVRWGWRDEPLEFRRSVNGASFLSTRGDLCAADFVEVLESDGRLVVFGGGIERHVRAEDNQLETVLPVNLDNDEHRIRLAIGIDVDGAAGDWASDWVTPALVHAAPSVPAAPMAWWLLCGSKRVRWTHLRPLTDGRSGFIARLQELTGRYVKTTVEAFRPIRRASRTNLQGQPLMDLPVEDGHIVLQMAGYQWIQVEAEWE